MRAVVISRSGGPEVLEIRDLPNPALPGGDQVLVQVHAAGLNRADLMQRAGEYPAPPGWPRDIPGLEFAGEVVATGPAVSGIRKGQRVMGIAGGGAQAEYLLVQEELVAAIPDELGWIDAAALPEVFITAHDAMFTQLGETVLIHAAASGVGVAAVQLARCAGCLVFGTSRTAAKLEKVRPLGLDEAFEAPRENPGAFADRILEATGGTGVDVIVDLVGGPYFEPNLKALAPCGRMICIGLTGGTTSAIDLGLIVRKRLRIVGTVLRARSTAEKAAAVRRFADHVLPLVRCGMLRPVVDSVYKPHEIAGAHRAMESNETFGKLVLDFD